MLFDFWQNFKVFSPSCGLQQEERQKKKPQTKSIGRQHPTAKLCNDMISQIFQYQYFAMPKATNETRQIFPGLLYNKLPAPKAALLAFCIYEAEGI